MLNKPLPSPQNSNRLLATSRVAKYIGKVKMAVQAAAQSYGNLSLNDIFGQRKSASRDNEITSDISANFVNECRFAVPPGTDVSSKI